MFVKPVRFVTQAELPLAAAVMAMPAGAPWLHDDGTGPAPGRQGRRLAADHVQGLVRSAQSAFRLGASAPQPEDSERQDAPPQTTSGSQNRGQPH